MAVVFEARDIVMNRIVAVKMLKEDLSDDAEAVKRFINESKAVSMLSHPNIVKIFDVSVKARLKYIVMERVEGITLKSYMQKKGALSREEVISYSEQVLRALEHAHSKGIVHRDIKPQNIMLLKNGRVKVTDFGIAVLPTGEKNPNGKAIGTVYYISPEQASGKETDTRSDLYSLGILMYEMATGTLPFNADTPISVAMMQVREQPKPPSEIRSDIPKGLEQIILGAMEKSPERRFQTATQMLKYVEKVHLNPEYIFKTRGEGTPETTASHAAKDMKKQKSKSTKRRKESNSMFPIILGVAVAFAIVLITGAITVLDSVLKSENANAAEQIKVPNVVGETYSQDSIDKLLDPSMFKVEIKMVYDAEHPAGTITKQEPVADSSRKIVRNKTKCTVTLTVSRGANLVSVPDLVSYSYSYAKYIAMGEENFNFTVELIPIPSETFKIGTVVKTEPAAGEKVQYGSKIKIYYSDGATEIYEYVNVDDYTGMTPALASTLIAGDLIIDKDTTYEYSDTVAEGRIVSQSLAPGERLKGSVIKFVISLGAPPATDPPETTPSETTPAETTPAETTTESTTTN